MLLQSSVLSLHFRYYPFILGKSNGLVAYAEDGAGDAMEGEDEDVNVETEDGPDEAEAAVTETEKVNYLHNL